MSFLGCLTVGSLDSFGVSIARDSDDLRDGKKRKGGSQRREKREALLEREKERRDAPCSNPSPSTVSADAELSGDG